MPLILGFAALAGGVLLLTSGITTASLSQVLKGQAKQVYDNNTGTPSGGATSSTAATPAANSAGEVNPVPGATGSRLDQGFDVTGKRFLAPFSGTVVASKLSDPGWGGGGFVAIANALNPKQVVYFAEGLLPTVSVGDSVTAGQSIAQAAINPYNGIIGNIEFGPANPSNPLQPLAQAVSDPAAVVTKFYNWVRGLGAPAASSTAHAGSA